MNKKPLIIIIVILLIALLVYLFTATKTVAPASSFEECVAAGNPVMESYPRQCRTEDGVLFVEEVEMPENTESVTTSGVVTAVDFEGIMVDGPYLITIETSTSTSATSTIAVPSMGMMMCAAYENVKNVADIKVGQKVEVKGNIGEGGIIIPCDSADHYLRVTN